MRVENNTYQSGYKTTSTDAASSGKFKDAIAEFMKSGSKPASARQTDTFERTSPATKSEETAKADESKALAKADEITMTQEQIDMLKEKYSPSDFYYINAYGEKTYHLLATRGEGKDEEFYQDIKEMGLVSEGDYDLLRIRELWLNERTGIRRVDTGEWITPEYLGREYRKELIDQYGEEEAKERIAEILDRGIGQGEMSDVLRKLAGIFQQVFPAESSDEAAGLIETCVKGAERFAGWTDSWKKAQNGSGK